MKRAGFVILCAACVTTAPLKAPVGLPQGWSACSSGESEAQIGHRPLRAEDSCGLGDAGCAAAAKALDPCSLGVALNTEQELVLRVKSDGTGRLAPVCLAAASGPVVTEVLACVSEALHGIEAPGLDNAPLRFTLANPAGITISDATGLTKEAIAETMRDALHGLRSCVDEQHRQVPHSKGTLLLEWRVTTDGSVHDLTSHSPELKNMYFSSCAIETIGLLRFPAHSSEGPPLAQQFRF